MDQLIHGNFQVLHQWHQIWNNAIIPTRETAGFSKDGPGTFEALQDGCFKKGRACAGWIIETGNMDYLKADRDGECPNGTQLSWDNTSCK